jgi:hypothetical protein
MFSNLQLCSVFMISFYSQNKHDCSVEIRAEFSQFPKAVLASMSGVCDSSQLRSFSGLLTESVILNHVSPLFELLVHIMAFTRRKYIVPHVSTCLY